MLQYGLVDNPLTAAPNDFTAQLVNVRSFSQEEILRRISERNTGLSPEQLRAGVDLYIREVCKITEDGGAVNTPLINTQPSIAGVFHGADDSYDQNRHRVRTNITSGLALRRATAAIRTQKVTIAEPQPTILEVTDMMSGAVNELLTPGGVLQIRGGRLKLATQNPDNGIFLIDEQGQTTPLPMVIENKPARLIAMLPATLACGAYTLEVRSSLSASNREGRTIRTGRFNRELTAVND